MKYYSFVEQPHISSVPNGVEGTFGLGGTSGNIATPESEIKGGGWSGEILDGAEFERGDGVQIARGEGHGELVWAEDEAVSRMVADW